MNKKYKNINKNAETFKDMFFINKIPTNFMIILFDLYLKITYFFCNYLIVVVIRKLPLSSLDFMYKPSNYKNLNNWIDL